MPGGLNDMRAGELAQIAEHISAAERRAMAAERETVDRVIAAHLADRVGAVFAGRIAGVTRVGLFVKLSETGADGFVPAATLGDEYFRFEEANRAHGRDADQGDVPAGRRGPGPSRRGRAIRRGARGSRLCGAGSEARGARSRSASAPRKPIYKGKRR